MKMAATNGSTIRGLRTKADMDDDRFVRFFSIVQDSARILGCTFFLWAGEGHEIETETFEGEDLSGWLIPESKAEDFEARWRMGLEALGDDFDDDFAFARWKIGADGNLVVSFENLSD